MSRELTDEELDQQVALDIFEQYSRKRKKMINEGSVPPWYITQGLFLFEKSYAEKVDGVPETPKERFATVAKTLARFYTVNPIEAEKRFFDLMWSGKLAPSTPVLANTGGKGRGHSVACSGGYVPDSIRGFYRSHLRNAMLSKLGYGTSDYLGDITPRGTPIPEGGTANGVIDQFENSIDAVANKVSQGNQRRGAWAGYLPISHGDFPEVFNYVFRNQAKSHIGWMFYDKDIQALKDGDSETLERTANVMYMRTRYGKGYIHKPDVANRLSNPAIKACGIPITSSNLCSEIMLPVSPEYTFSCVLSSLNLSLWDEITDDDIFWSIAFLDCVTSLTIEQLKDDEDLKTLCDFTKDFRALGLGTLGYHTYLQKNSIPFGSVEGYMANKRIFKRLEEQTLLASQKLAKLYGEPKWCKGLGVRNATRIAVAPNTSSAILCGGTSQGIEPLAANYFVQPVSSGEITRINPTLIKVLKEKGKWNNETIDRIVKDQGSVQRLDDILTDHERAVFLTAYEIDQMDIVRQAEMRQGHICQAQSLNLFFLANEEDYIARVTRYALESDKIISLYYQRNSRDVRGSSGECVACEG